MWIKCWMNKEKFNKESCTFQNKENFYKESILDKCSEYCPNECDTVKYSVSVSSVTKKSNPNITSIRVFYRSLNYMSIKQEPKMDLIDLVSSIGGIFGLFAGLSFVSLFEMMEIFIEIIPILIEFKFWKISNILNLCF